MRTKKVTTTGLKNPEKHVGVFGDSIWIHDIIPTKSGKFTINAPYNSSGSIRLHNSAYIPALNIDNYSELSIDIQKIFLVGDYDGTQNIQIEMRLPSTISVTEVMGGASKVEIISHKNGDITFMSGSGGNGRVRYNDFDAGEGSIYIKTNGGNVYTDYSAFIVANSVTIEGAKIFRIPLTIIVHFLLCY